MYSGNGTRPVVAGFGESLWDVFDQVSSFGGAPANFACHAAALGAEAWLVSAVGDDTAGSEALAILCEHNVNVDTIACLDGIPTGSVRVSLDGNGCPAYDIRRDVAWDHIEWSPAVEELARSADAVCFGTLAQRDRVSRETLRRFLGATRPECLRVFDVNLRGDYFDREIVEESLRQATALKVSDEELPVLAEMFALVGADEAARTKELRARFDLPWIILTRGSRGAAVFGEFDEAVADANAVNVRDTVGAGDSFTATITVGLLLGSPLNDLVPHACRVAEYVCTQSGAVPPLPAKLRQLPGMMPAPR